MKNSVFDILRFTGNKESAVNFNFSELMRNVKMQETSSHLYITNFPGAFGDTQNKNNRVYDQNSLVFAVEQFNSVKDQNPYFCYMFDGHKDDDSYENIIGRVVKLHIRPDIKCVLIDMKINKGSRSWQTIKNIVMDGDPIGASMRILSPTAITVSKDALREMNPDIAFLDNDNENLAHLMSKDSEIEYITGESFIQRFDITWFPSFNASFVSKPFLFDPLLNRTESFGPTPQKFSPVKLQDYKESAVLFSIHEKCVTNGCKFRHTIKDFVDLISMDESIKSIKDNPALYDDMLKFSYLNLDAFDFDKITDSNYLSSTLTSEDITISDVKKQNETIRKFVDGENIIGYTMDSTEFVANKLTSLLNNTINILVDEDNIFYQLVTINYVHFLVLSSLLLTGKAGSVVNKIDVLEDKLKISIDDDQSDNNIIIDLIKKIGKVNINTYDFINSIFSYIYQYVNEFSNKTAPLAIINESMKIFKSQKQQSVVENKYIKLK